MWVKEQGIVLSTVRHNDNTSIMRVFTRTKGCAAFVFRIGKSQHSIAKNALQQALTRIEFQTEYVPSSTLLQLREIRNLRPNCSIAASPAKSAIALFLSEFLTQALKGESCNPKLFGFLSSSLEWLEQADDSDCANFHIAVMLGVANCLGISPDMNGYREGYVLDLREGCFSTSCSHSDFASAQESKAIYGLLASSLEEMGNTPLDGRRRIMILKTLTRYFRLHMPDFPDLDSTDILEAVFA